MRQEKILSANFVYRQTYNIKIFNFIEAQASYSSTQVVKPFSGIGCCRFMNNCIPFCLSVVSDIGCCRFMNDCVPFCLNVVSDICEKTSLLPKSRFIQFFVRKTRFPIEKKTAFYNFFEGKFIVLLEKRKRNFREFKRKMIFCSIEFYCPPEI